MKSNRINFVMIDAYSTNDVKILSDVTAQLKSAAEDKTVVFCISSTNTNAMQSVRRMFIQLAELGITQPVVLVTDSSANTPDEHLIHFATETGALLLDGLGDGISLGFSVGSSLDNPVVKGRTYLHADFQNRVHQLSELWPHPV